MRPKLTTHHWHLPACCTWFLSLYPYVPPNQFLRVTVESSESGFAGHRFVFWDVMPPGWFCFSVLSAYLLHTFSLALWTCQMSALLWGLLKRKVAYQSWSIPDTPALGCALMQNFCQTFMWRQNKVLERQTALEHESKYRIVRDQITLNVRWGWKREDILSW